MTARGWDHRHADTSWWIYIYILLLTVHLVTFVIYWLQFSRAGSCTITQQSVINIIYLGIDILQYTAHSFYLTAHTVNPCDVVVAVMMTFNLFWIRRKEHLISASETQLFAEIKLKTDTFDLIFHNHDSSETKRHGTAFVWDKNRLWKSLSENCH